VKLREMVALVANAYGGPAPENGVETRHEQANQQETP
jgi:hypothetical protein